jgi:hypothetical protein
MKLRNNLWKSLLLATILILPCISLSSATSAALENAEVTVNGNNGQGFTMTGSDGIFNITQGLGAGNYTVQVYHAGYVSRTVDAVITAGATTDLGDIGLKTSAKIQGVVEDPNGSPVANVNVLCLDESDNNSVASAITLNDGSFSLDTDITNGSYTVAALVLSGSPGQSGYASNMTAGITATEGQTTSGVVVQLKPSGTISGTVKDKGDVPIASASIAVSPQSYAGDLFYGGFAITNSHGSYTIDSNLPTGTYKVFISDARGFVYSYVTDYQNATVTTGQTTTVNFSIDHSGVISGTVTLSGGSPAAHTTVSASSLDFNYFGSAETDDNGVYRIDSGLGTDQYMVTAASDYMNSEIVNVTAGAETSNVDFQITRNLAWITGSVKDNTNNPIPFASLSALSEGISANSYVDYNSNYTMEIELPDGQNSAELNVTASAKGYISLSQNVTVNLGQTTSNIHFTLQLVPQGTLTGRVVAAIGDTTAPGMTNVLQDPPADSVSPQNSAKVNVTVTDDASGVKQVTLNYTSGNGTWTGIAMSNIGANLWSATIPAFPYGTNITYVIQAEDNAGNTATTPSTAYQYQVIPEYPTLTVLLPLFIMSTLLAARLRRKRFSNRPSQCAGTDVSG